MAWSEVKVSIRTKTLCIGSSETCSCLARNFVKFENNLVEKNIMTRHCVTNKNYSIQFYSIP